MLVVVEYSSMRALSIYGPVWNLVLCKVQEIHSCSHSQQDLALANESCLMIPDTPPLGGTSTYKLLSRAYHKEQNRVRK